MNALFVKVSQINPPEQNPQSQATDLSSEAVSRKCMNLVTLALSSLWFKTPHYDMKCQPQGYGLWFQGVFAQKKIRLGLVD